MKSAGTLFVVATPIGNLGDVTLRAIETLRSVGLVLAEDTRRTRALLSHLGIERPRLERFDAAATPGTVERIVGRLVEGLEAALCSDAGTPVVSDPGSVLVRAAAAAGVRVVPIPGPSAVTAALSASGMVDGGFRFVGFLPRSGTARREALARIAETSEAVVLFEAPQRAAATIADLSAVAPRREAMIARELTKLHEELWRGDIEDLARSAADREWLGEITIVLGPRPVDAAPSRWNDDEMDRAIDAGLSAGRRSRDIAEALALESGWTRREVYARVVTRRG